MLRASPGQRLPWTLWLSALALLTAAGCASVTARVAGWYVTRKIDSYLDLTSEQHRWMRTRVDETLNQARREELPRWLYLFRELRDTLDEGASDEKLRKLQERYDWLTDEALTLLAPRMAEAFSKLSDGQIDHFEKRMLETLDDTYAEQLMDEEDRREELDERLIDAIEDTTGDLSDEQERTILKAAHALPNERPVQYAVGKKRIGASADFLRTHPSAEAIEAEIHRLWRTRYQVLGPGRGKPERRAEQRQFLLAVDSTLSREQRDHAVEEVNERIVQAKRFVLPAP